MKTTLASLGMYFLGTIICTFFAIMFVKGWGTFVTIAAFVIVYFVSTVFIYKSYPKLWWIAAIVITSYLLIWGFHIIGLGNIIELLVEPSLIDSRNFYKLLPLIAFVSSFAGSYVGYKLSMREEMHLKSDTYGKKTD